MKETPSGSTELTVKVLRAGGGFISDWLRNRNTVEFLGIWEQINNPDFNYGEFAIIKSQVGLNSYKISVQRLSQPKRLIMLNQVAIVQMKSLLRVSGIKKLESGV